MRRPPGSTRTATLLPYTTLLRPHVPEVMLPGGGCRPGHRRVLPLWVDLKLALYCCGYAPATRDCVTSQLHSSHPRLRIPDMTRPLPIAASLVLAAQIGRAHV